MTMTHILHRKAFCSLKRKINLWKEGWRIWKVNMTLGCQWWQTNTGVCRLGTMLQTHCLPPLSLSTQICSWMTYQIHSPLEIPAQSILKLIGGQRYHSEWLTKMMWLLASRGREAIFRRVSQEISKVGYQFWCDCIELTMTNESHLLDTVQTMQHSSKEQYIRRRNKLLSNPYRHIIATTLQMAEKQATTKQ